MKTPPEYKEVIVDPFISTESNQARITLRVKDSDPKLRRNELIKKIKKEAPEILQVEGEKVKLSNILILYNNMLQSLFSSQILTLGLVIVNFIFNVSYTFLVIKSINHFLLPNLLSIGSVLGILEFFQFR